MKHTAVASIPFRLQQGRSAALGRPGSPTRWHMHTHAQIASDGLKGRIIDVNLADLQQVSVVFQQLGASAAMHSGEREGEQPQRASVLSHST